MQQQNCTFCDIAKTFHSYTHTYVFVQLHPFRWPSPYTMYGLSLFTFICSSNTHNTHPIYEMGFQIHFRILYTFCTEIKREKLERFFNDDDDGGGYLEPGELINFVLHFAFDIHNIAPVSGGCATQFQCVFSLHVGNERITFAVLMSSLSQFSRAHQNMCGGCAMRLFAFVNVGKTFESPSIFLLHVPHTFFCFRYVTKPLSFLCLYLRC